MKGMSVAIRLYTKILRLFEQAKCSVADGYGLKQYNIDAVSDGTKIIGVRVYFFGEREGEKDRAYYDLDEQSATYGKRLGSPDGATSEMKKFLASLDEVVAEETRTILTDAVDCFEKICMAFFVASGKGKYVFFSKTARSVIITCQPDKRLVDRQMVAVYDFKAGTFTPHDTVNPDIAITGYLYLLTAVFDRCLALVAASLSAATQPSSAIPSCCGKACIHGHIDFLKNVFDAILRHHKNQKIPRLDYYYVAKTDHGVSVRYADRFSRLADYDLVTGKRSDDNVNASQELTTIVVPLFNAVFDHYYAFIKKILTTEKPVKQPKEPVKETKAPAKRPAEHGERLIDGFFPAKLPIAIVFDILRHAGTPSFKTDVTVYLGTRKNRACLKWLYEGKTDTEDPAEGSYVAELMRDPQKPEEKSQAENVQAENVQAAKERLHKTLFQTCMELLQGITHKSNLLKTQAFLKLYYVLFQDLEAEEKCIMSGQAARQCKKLLRSRILGCPVERIAPHIHALWNVLPLEGKVEVANEILVLVVTSFYKEFADLFCHLYHHDFDIETQEKMQLQIVHTCGHILRKISRVSHNEHNEQLSDLVDTYKTLNALL